MTPVERCYKAILREMPDRVPVVPLAISHSVRLAGVPFESYNKDPKLLAECQAALWRAYDFDGIHISSDNWVLPEALGVRIRFYSDKPPTGLERPLAHSKELRLLPSFEQARSAARMALLPAATRHARAMLGDACFLKTNFDQGPFSLATAVRGIERLMLDMTEDPGFVFDLLEICTRLVSNLGVEVGRAGAHAVTFGDSVAGLISRKDYLRFAFPCEKRVIEQLHAALDAPVFLHICGRTGHIVEDMAATGADALELDHFNDFAEMKMRVGPQVCLEGNLDPTGVMRNGTPELVRAKCRELIQAAALGGGFILSPGCECPPDVPAENMRAMVDAAREFQA